MKSNPKKYDGFTLVEVVISMAIIAIVCIAIYNGYAIIINHTKNGQVKQMAALEGKKVIEQLQAIDFNLPNDNEALNIDEIELKKSTINSDTYVRYLDNNYNCKDANGNDISEASRKYSELVTITPTQANGEKITFDNSPMNEPVNKCTIYIGKENLGEYITCNSGQHEINNLPSQIEDGSAKIVISIYITKITGDNKENIEIKDYKGEGIKDDEGKLLSMTNDISNGLYIDLSGYKENSDSAKKDEIEVNIYNEIGSTQNIYIEKINDLDVNVKARKGEINVYDNRAINSEESKVGTLFDIKVEIRDYKKDINGEIKADKDNLFTGYSKKNIKE